MQVISSLAITVLDVVSSIADQVISYQTTIIMFFYSFAGNSFNLAILVLEDVLAIQIFSSTFAV